MTTPPLINEAELVSFNGAAAGHDGVLTDASGALIIKPCTTIESSFYKSAAADHPEFAARLLPTFYGCLTLSTQEQREALTRQDPMSINAALQAQEATAQQIVESGDTNHLQSSSQQLFGKKLETDHAVVLENVAAGFKKPNILDVKLGSRLWDDAARPEKRQRLEKVSKETTSHDLGFRIAGMRVWQPGAHSKDDEARGQYKVYDKYYGRAFTPATVRSGFEEFFLEAGPTKRQLTKLRRAVMEVCEAELLDMEQQLERVESRMYSSSILVVYEGDNDALNRALNAFDELQRKEVDGAVSADSAHVEHDNDDDDDGGPSEDEEDMPKIHAVKLIDFAHARWTPGEGPDENMLKGVRNVRTILRQILSS